MFFGRDAICIGVLVSRVGRIIAAFLVVVLLMGLVVVEVGGNSKKAIRKHIEVIKTKIIIQRQLNKSVLKKEKWENENIAHHGNRAWIVKIHDIDKNQTKGTDIEIESRAPSSWYMLIDAPGYYELTADIIDCTKECGIYINSSNVVLDGRGHILDGVNNNSSKYGIYVENAENVTIRNIIIQEWYLRGICLRSSSNNSIHNNTIQNNDYGIFLDDLSNSNTIYNNTIQNNDYCGIFLDIGSNNNNIYDSTIRSNSGYGIFLNSASNNSIYSNTIQNNDYGIFLESSSNNNIIILNSFVGNSINTFEDNTWFTPTTIAFRYQGIWYIGQLGNYWDAYTGNDTDGNHVGDTPFEGDSAPLIDDSHKYYIGDYDNDGLWDLHEATIYNTNALEIDTDGDTLPDGWEIKYGLNATNYEDVSKDRDGDGLTNLEEYQRGTNPVVADTDADGMPDGWEVQHSLNPVNCSDGSLDFDGDSLSNVHEFQFGTDPWDPDSDSDGYDDGVEVRFGTNPNDPSDYPVSTIITVTSTVTATEVSSAISTETFTMVVEGVSPISIIVVLVSVVAMLFMVSLIFVLRKRSLV